MQATARVAVVALGDRLACKVHEGGAADSRHLDGRLANLHHEHHEHHELCAMQRTSALPAAFCVGALKPLNQPALCVTQVVCISAWVPAARACMRNNAALRRAMAHTPFLPSSNIG